MKFKSIIVVAAALGIGYSTIEQITDTIQPATAQARSVNNPDNWHKGTPKVLRKTWKASYSKVFKTRFKFKITPHTYAMGGIDGDICKNASYQYLGSHIYELRGTPSMYPDQRNTLYVRYYSKHKIRTGGNIQSNSSHWRLWTH